MDIKTLTPAQRMEVHESLYVVMNETDGIPASPDAMTYEAADKFCREFIERFAGQGYYLTAAGQRINPNEISLAIEPIEENE